MVSNDGFGFPGLHEPIEINSLGQLIILGCPPNAQSHSLDQIIVLYSTVPDLLSGGHDGKHIDLLPTDNILFSGDLWLMKGPFYERWHKNLFLRFKPIRQGYFRIKPFISKGDKSRRDPQEQDMKAKEVLNMQIWKEQGYRLEEISELLTRIFKEQIGGPSLVAKDRNQINIEKDERRLL